MYRGSLSSSWNRQHPFPQVSWFFRKDQGVGGEEREGSWLPFPAPHHNTHTRCHLWKDLKAKPLTEGGLPSGPHFINQDALNRQALSGTVFQPLALGLFQGFLVMVLLTFGLDNYLMGGLM